jgi:hypothetical protein
MISILNPVLFYSTYQSIKHYNLKLNITKQYMNYLNAGIQHLRGWCQDTECVKLYFRSLSVLKSTGTTSDSTYSSKYT